MAIRSMIFAAGNPVAFATAAAAAASHVSAPVDPPAAFWSAAAAPRRRAFSAARLLRQRPRARALRMGSKSVSLDLHAQLERQPEEEAAKLISKVNIGDGEGDGNLRTELYPSVDVNQTGFLQVSDLHSLYWEESGNEAGQPVIFLHGGPGAGTNGGNRRFFDPKHYRIVLLDQRGAGKSTPHACVEENTTWDLINDIEKLREHLGIEKWMVFGGSWGSTLALTYAQAHPEKVTGIVLRGIFLLRKKEIDWFYQSGTSSIFPDAWEPYRDFIPKEERHDFLTAYSKRLKSDDPAIQSFSASSSKSMDKLGNGNVPPVAQCGSFATR